MVRSVRVHPDRLSFLRQALERNGFLTQGELAAHLDIALSTVNNFLNGKNVSISKFDAICEALRLDRNQLLQPLETSTPDTHAAPSLEDPQPDSPIRCRIEEISRQFVGREQELADLHNRLQPRVPLLIEGMRGVGKTELSKQYAVLHLNDYPGGVLWTPASSAGFQILNFVKGFGKKIWIPEDLHSLEEQVSVAWERWPGDGKILLVLDNVTEYRTVSPFLAKPLLMDRVRILMTSWRRLPEVEERVELKVLPLEAAMELLRLSIGDPARVEGEYGTAVQLCEWVGCLPLAVKLMGGYLREIPDYSLAKLYRRLQDQAEAKQSMKNPILKDVEALLEVVWDLLSEPAQYLGYLLSWFELAPIRWTAVEEMVEEYDLPIGDLEDAKRELLTLNLLEQVERLAQGIIYRQHELVYLFFREKSGENDDEEDS